MASTPTAERPRSAANPIDRAKRQREDQRLMRLSYAQTFETLSAKQRRRELEKFLVVREKRPKPLGESRFSRIELF